MQATPIIVVLGHKLDQNGACTADFIQRIKKGVELAQAKPNSRLLITGGATRSKFPPEAERAFAYITETYEQSDRVIAIKSKQHAGAVLKTFVYGLTSRILLESQARATSEHPRLVKQMLRDHNITPTVLTIVTSTYHLRRTEFLFVTHWPEMRSQMRFVGVGTPTTVDRIMETVLLGAAYLDPFDRWLLRLPKRLLRNG
jgi:uncharacterized SAM-binding protein YcdF (DUF218 family)